MNIPIMQRLKQETSLYHKAIEQHINLEQLCSSVEMYRHMLQRFYGFYRPVEQKLSQLPWHTLDFDFAARQKQALIEHDLTLFGEDRTSLNQLPQCATLPNLEEFPQALGCLYVLEGSTLGGQLITNHVERTLRISPEWGSAFFYSYGSQVGPMWKQFAAFIAKYTDCSSSENEIVRENKPISSGLDSSATVSSITVSSIIVSSAIDTFVTLHSWLKTEDYTKIS